jgi:hypothetical protein
VLEWLRGLAKEDRHVIGSDLMRVQFGWPIGMPLGSTLNAAEPVCSLRLMVLKQAPSASIKISLARKP